ncbi:MAG: outer membrane lipoprotein-sorting protein [Verrucomicrobia bacterium]|nr:outer membrane lipoprotein-sorting protein [Verrucomicrobiota bacterium]
MSYPGVVRILFLLVLIPAWVFPRVSGAEGPTRSEAEGQALAADLRALKPVESFTNQATLRLRDAEGGVRRLPLTIVNRVSDAPSWEVTYAAGGPKPETLTLIRTPDRPPEYRVARGGEAAAGASSGSADSARAFAGSDFTLRELGLEFLHWPGQRIVPRSPPPMKKGQPCKILESTHPQAPGYTRVVSWVSIEHNGLMLADAYDASGRIVKRFSIGSLKKVDGVWQLRDMEMIDEVRGTETKLEFELKTRE